MSQTEELSPVDIFLKSWRVYQEIIEHNYMFHREISTAARLALEEDASCKALRILDLGCGDASMALPFLSADRIAAYVGCDLSQPALDIAKEKLKTLDIPYRLFCDDMLRFMEEQADASADLVLASYAIHHLNANDKQRLIRDVARVLSPEGRFLLIDIFREPHEERIDYVANYMQKLRQDWTALSTEAQDLVVDHATQYDFPEPSSFYATHCQNHGFDTGRCLTKHTWHEAWAFTKTCL